MDRPPFDPMRAAFLLVAMVLAVDAVVVVAVVGACLYHAEVIIKNPDIKCDPDGRVFQLLAAALAAAMAFMGSKK